MPAILIKWSGLTIRQRDDGLLSATVMCKACGKLFANWSNLKSTKEYLAVLATHYCDPNNAEFVESQVGGSPESTGTWVHRKVAIRLAQWLSPEFAVHVDKWVEELLLTGKVELTEQPAPPHQQLPPADIRLKDFCETLQFFGFDIENPRFKQGLKDIAGDILGLTQQRQLTATEELWYGVAERAEQLGYKPSLIVRYRSSLGKFVKSHGFQNKKEHRLCNGTERTINVYLVNDEFDAAIHEYLDAKILSAA